MYTTIHCASWGHSAYATSQWEMALQCNAISHWLGAHTESSLAGHTPNRCRRTYVIVVVADAPVPTRHQAISNHQHNLLCCEIHALIHIRKRYFGNRNWKQKRVIFQAQVRRIWKKVKFIIHKCIWTLTINVMKNTMYIGKWLWVWCNYHRFDKKMYFIWYK